MANQRILYSEEMVGYGHPTKADTLNRAFMVKHAEDGTHTDRAASGANTDITSLGGITTSLFQAKITSTQSDVTGDNTIYDVIGAIWTEITDRAANFSNGTFIAPVAGEHLLCGAITIDGLLVAHTYGYFAVVTSNRTYFIAQGNLGALAAVATFSFSLVADMDINDTAYLQVVVYSGTKVIDISANTWFMGYLLP